MKRVFSGLVLVGIFLLGVTEWGRSIERNFAQKDGRRTSAITAQTTFGSAGLAVPKRALSSLIAPSSPLEIATRYLEDNREALGIQPHHEMRPVEFKTPLSTHIRFSVYDLDTPLLDMGIEIEISKNRRIASIENNYRPVAPAERSGTILPMTQVTSLFKETHEIDDKSLSDSILLYAPQGVNAPEWVYVIPARDKASRTPMQLLVRATDGALLAKHHSRKEF